MKIDGIAVFVNEETGEVREVPATAEISFDEPVDDRPKNVGTRLGYSRRYADSWDRVFAKREEMN